jgi:hypothetical protein
MTGSRHSRRQCSTRAYLGRPRGVGVRRWLTRGSPLDGWPVFAGPGQERVVSLSAWLRVLPVERLIRWVSLAVGGPLTWADRLVAQRWVGCA